MNTVKTPKGTVLPLTNLKGRDYLMVAYRIQWMNEEVKNFDISTEFLELTETHTIAKARVSLFNEEGKMIRSATATKRETKSDFSDHTEKAETSAIGRALAMLGYGTQFALADLDEGSRLADSPVVNPKSSPSVQAEPAKKASSFRKPPVKAEASMESNVGKVSNGSASKSSSASTSDWQ